MKCGDTKLFAQVGFVKTLAPLLLILQVMLAKLATLS